MKIINQIKYKETDFNFMVEKNYVGYSFEKDGKSYGQKTELKTKKRNELIATVATLTINAIETLQALNENPNPATN